MPSLLILNPNTSETVTEGLAAQARSAFDREADLTVRTATARFGARYISGEAAAAIAGHAALDAWAVDAARHGPADAVLLACFGDPGLFALRALSPRPVLGLAEASMREAAALGPFVIVTGGAAWGPMLQRLALTLDLPAPLRGVSTVAASGGALAADPEGAVVLLREAAHDALARWPEARSVLLGGAALGGMAAAVGVGLPVPVLDNVQLALRRTFAAARTPADPARPRAVETGPWLGLDATLTAALSGPPRPQAST
jgi:Asp/Glu/hydantoin racemase